MASSSSSSSVEKKTREEKDVDNKSSSLSAVQVHLYTSSPPSSSEKKNDQNCKIEINKETKKVTVNKSTTYAHFDNIFQHSSSQKDVYNRVIKESNVIQKFINEKQDVTFVSYGHSSVEHDDYIFYGEGNFTSLASSSDDHNHDDDDEEEDEEEEEDSCVSSLSSCGVSEAQRKSNATTASSVVTNNHHKLAGTLLLPPSQVFTTTSSSSSRGGKQQSILHPRSLLGSTSQTPPPQQQQQQAKKKKKKEEKKEYNKLGLLPRLIPNLFQSSSSSPKKRSTLYIQYVALHNNDCIHDLLSEQTSIEHSSPPPSTTSPKLEEVNDRMILKDTSTIKCSEAMEVLQLLDIYPKTTLKVLQESLMMKKKEKHQEEEKLTTMHTIFSISLVQQDSDGDDDSNSEQDVQKLLAKAPRMLFVNLADGTTLCPYSSTPFKEIMQSLLLPSLSSSANFPPNPLIIELLQDSFGGNANLQLFTTIDKNGSIAEECRDVLEFGQLVKQEIQNTPLSRRGGGKETTKNEKKRVAKKDRERMVKVTTPNDDGINSKSQSDKPTFKKGTEQSSNKLKGKSSSSKESSSKESSSKESSTKTKQQQQPAAAETLMTDDLATAREELTTVSSLLRSAAQRMEVDLSVAREELFSTDTKAKTTAKNTASTDTKGVDGSKTKKKPQSAAQQQQQQQQPFSLSTLNNKNADNNKKELSQEQQQPLHLTAHQIELDLEAAKRELMGVASDMIPPPPNETSDNIVYNGIEYMVVPPSSSDAVLPGGGGKRRSSITSDSGNSNIIPNNSNDIIADENEDFLIAHHPPSSRGTTTNKNREIIPKSSALDDIIMKTNQKTFTSSEWSGVKEFLDSSSSTSFGAGPTDAAASSAAPPSTRNTTTTTATATTTTSSIPNPNNNAAILSLQTQLQQKDLTISKLQSQIVQLQNKYEMEKKQRENQYEHDVRRMKKDIKVLTLRCMETESRLKKLQLKEEEKSKDSKKDSTSLLSTPSTKTDQNDDDDDDDDKDIVGVSNIVGGGGGGGGADQIFDSENTPPSFTALNNINNDDGAQNSDDDDSFTKDNVRAKPLPDSASKKGKRGAAAAGDGTAVNVCLRLRPMSKLETSRRSRNCVEVHEGNRKFTVDSPLDGEYDFCYDQVFDTDSSQATVYKYAGASVVSNLLSGINCCIMAYGLTSSGKTYTLMGSLPEVTKHENTDGTSTLHSNAHSVEEDVNAGIAPRLIKDLFSGMTGCPASIKFTVRCSYVAIYLEKILDLLEPHVNKTLSVYEDLKGVQVDGASEAYCFNETDVIALIQRGKACQSVLSTRMNMDTSRTHSIFIIKVDQYNVRTGVTKVAQLYLADLAGFEMTVKSKGQTMQETKIIHKSFSALGNVIKALTEGSVRAPYRESKLTCVLKEAFGGNCKTTLIINASPSSYNISETINTIRLGQRVRRVINMPRVNREANIEDYKKWLMATEIKLGELVAFIKEFSSAFLKEIEEQAKQLEGFQSLSSLSSPLWNSIVAIAEEEETASNPCRRALSIGAIDELKDHGPKWRALSMELAKRLPSEELAIITKARNRAETLLSDIQSEVVVLRRQNELLVQDKRKKEEELMTTRHDVKLLTLQKTEIEQKLSLSEYREKEAVAFLRHLRKICWRLQKDFATERVAEIAEITSCISGTPDLSGLVDLDSLLLEEGLIETREIDDNDDSDDILFEPAKDSTKKNMDGDENEREEAAGANEMEVDFGHRPEIYMEDGGERHTGESKEENAWNNANKWINSLVAPNTWLRRETSKQNLGVTDISPEDEDHTLTPKELQLKRDLRIMANKCIELQVSLNEEKAKVETMTNRAGSLHRKRLAQEAIALRREKDQMMHNAKAATWKLQELHVVNRVLFKKATESKDHVLSLEDGLQRLQETFRTTVLDSLQADSQLRERVALLEAIVDSLTVPQNQTIELDALSSPVPRMNLPIRGRLEWKKGSFKTPDSNNMPDSSPHCLMLVPSLKLPEKTPSSSVPRKAKFPRRSRKMGDSIGGLKKKEIASQFRLCQSLKSPKFDGDMYIFSYLNQQSALH